MYVHCKCGWGQIGTVRLYLWKEKELIVADTGLLKHKDRGQKEMEWTLNHSAHARLRMFPVGVFLHFEENPTEHLNDKIKNCEECNLLYLVLVSVNF